MTTTPDIPRFAEYILENYYNTADEARAIRDYARITECSTSDAVADDIRDLLHNGNVEDIFDTDGLTDDEVEALALRFHDDFDQLGELSDFITTLLDTHYPLKETNK